MKRNVPLIAAFAVIILFTVSMVDLFDEREETDEIFDPLGSEPFVPTTGITGIPTTAPAGMPLTPIGTVTPSNAIYPTISGSSSGIVMYTIGQEGEWKFIEADGKGVFTIPKEEVVGHLTIELR